MYFSEYGTARKNGFIFEIKTSEYLHGKPVDPFYLYCAKPSEDIRTFTTFSHRFPTRKALEDFCEKIASGEVSLAQLKADEDRAYSSYYALETDRAWDKVDAFFVRMNELGVDSNLIPVIVNAYLELNPHGNKKVYDVFQSRLKAIKDADQFHKANPDLQFGSLNDKINQARQSSIVAQGQPMPHPGQDKKAGKER